MKKIEVTAKTVQQAIDEGLNKLGAKLTDVNVKIISNGGLFAKAKVEISLNEETEVEKIASKKETKESVKKESTIDLNNENFTNEEVEALKKLAEEVNVKETKVAEFDEIKQHVLTFLNGLIYAYNVYAEVVVEKDGKDIIAKINGENLGVLIGKHGEAMEAVQYLLNTYLHNKMGLRKRVFLDVENYREKRQNNLKEMALKLSDRVKQSKKSFKLEPMNSFERRVIHEALSNIQNISTHSEGEEPNRYLVIDYVE